MTGEYVRKKLQKNNFQLVEIAKKMNITPQNLQSKLNSKDLKVSFLFSLAKSVNKSVYFFFSDEYDNVRQGKILDIDEVENYKISNDKKYDKKYDKNDEKRKMQKKSYFKTPSIIDKRPIIEINPEGQFNTVVADVRASAGFGTFIDNPKQLEELPSISLPNAPYGLNVAFQIEGDSMHPTIRHLDYIASNKLTNFEDIRDGNVYILIDKDDGTLCKRVYKTSQGVEIKSDNPNYPPYYRNKEDIVAVFKCFMRLSTDFRSYHDDTRSAIEELKNRMTSIENRLLND